MNKQLIFNTVMALLQLLNVTIEIEYDCGNHDRLQGNDMIDMLDDKQINHTTFKLYLPYSCGKCK